MSLLPYPMTSGPAVRIEFTFADGELLSRDLNVEEANVVVERIKTPPAWLLNPLRIWAHPQDPITFSGEVAQGYEDEARELVTP